ncbi:unnamed protein product, partial [Ilex paraguariensis]
MATESDTTSQLSLYRTQKTHENSLEISPNKRLKTPEDSPTSSSKGKAKLREKEEDDNESATTNSETNCCGICLSEEGSSIRGWIDSCEHYFCFVCIMEWAKVESKCPICKRRFSTIRRPPKRGVFPSQRIVTVPVRDQFLVAVVVPSLLVCVAPSTGVASGGYCGGVFKPNSDLDPDPNPDPDPDPVQSRFGQFSTGSSSGSVWLGEFLPPGSTVQYVVIVQFSGPTTVSWPVQQSNKLSCSVQLRIITVHLPISIESKNDDIFVVTSLAVPPGLPSAALFNGLMTS